MSLTQQLATFVRQLHFGDNWTSSSLQEKLKDVDWEQATTKVDSLNTIAALTFHMSYYVEGLADVLEGGPLVIRDKFSWDQPPIESEEDWEVLKEKAFSGAERFASLIEQMPEERLWEDFWENKYGNYYRNIHANIEHSHYHLGQIALIKKLLAAKAG